MIRKRHYKTQTHFNEHLKRYLGLCADYPDVVVDEVRETVDIHDRMAYFAVKGIMKRRGLSRYYRSIFTVLHSCGGPRPQCGNDSAFIESCRQSFT